MPLRLDLARIRIDLGRMPLEEHKQREEHEAASEAETEAEPERKGERVVTVGARGCWRDVARDCWRGRDGDSEEGAGGRSRAKCSGESVRDARGGGADGNGHESCDDHGAGSDLDSNKGRGNLGRRERGEMRGERCRGRVTRRGDEARRGREGEGRCGSHPGRQRKPELEIRLNLLIIVGHAAGRHKRDIDRSSAPLNVTQNVNARRDPFEERAAQGVDAAAHWCRRGVAQRTRRTEAPACGARAALEADDRGHCLCGLGGRDVRRGR